VRTIRQDWPCGYGRTTALASISDFFSFWLKQVSDFDLGRANPYLERVGMAAAAGQKLPATAHQTVLLFTLP